MLWYHLSRSRTHKERRSQVLDHDPTFLGHIREVTGSTVTVALARSVDSGLSVIGGKTYRVGQVGSFVRVPQGYYELFGVVSSVGAAAPSEQMSASAESGRWMQVELVGEALGGTFERGVSQYPNIGEPVHLAVEEQLRKLYQVEGEGHPVIGALSSAESIPARIALNQLVTRHSAVLGSTGCGKSTTVATLLRAVADPGERVERYPSARILLLDVHGEYSKPLASVSQVFSVEPQAGEDELSVPYWALHTEDLLEFLIGGLDDRREVAFRDKILELKRESHERQSYPGANLASITVDTPLPYSLARLWYELMDFEVATFEGDLRDEPALVHKGDPAQLIPPVYKPHAMGSKGPFLNSAALGIRRPLNLVQSRMLDKRYSFLLSPGPWTPGLDGRTTKDLDQLLEGWMGGPNPVTILDLSGVPSLVLERLIGSILNIIYEALFWSREKSEGGFERPLLIVMEEAHRYLSGDASGTALEVVRRIAKEGRKYGVGAMIVSQRPSEVDETVLSQCGTLVAMRLTNPADRSRVHGTLPDGLVGLLDALPILRNGEAIVTGEAASLPMRCRIILPEEQYRPRSEDPEVTSRWQLDRRVEGYDRVVASWRAQSAYAVADELQIQRVPVHDKREQSEGIENG